MAHWTKLLNIIFNDVDAFFKCEFTNNCGGYHVFWDTPASSSQKTQGG